MALRFKQTIPIDHASLGPKSFWGQILFFLDRDNPINKTKLNKLLFFSAAAYWCERVDAVNNEEGERNFALDVVYLRLDHGPVPNNIDQTLLELENSGYIRLSLIDHGSYSEYRITKGDVPEKLEDAAFDKVRQEILSLTKRTLGQISASKISNLSHSIEPWNSTAPLGVLDFRKLDDDPRLKEKGFDNILKYMENLDKE